MPFLSRVMSFWRNIFKRRQVEQDLNDELMSYAEEVIQRHLGAGMNPDAAREAARLEVGGMDGLKERVRRQHIGSRSLARTARATAFGLAFFAAGVAASFGYGHWKNYSAAKFTEGANLVSTRPPTIEGIVLIKNSRFPLSNVEVELRSKFYEAQKTTSDAWGRFSFTNLHPGQFRLAVGGKNVEIPLPTACANENPDLAPPASAAYKVYIAAKDGNAMAGDAIKLTQGETIVAENHSGNQRQVRAYISSEDRLDIAATVWSERNSRFRLYRYLDGKLDNGIPWGPSIQN